MHWATWHSSTHRLQGHVVAVVHTEYDVDRKNTGEQRAQREVVLATTAAAAQQTLEVARRTLLFDYLMPMYHPRGATAPLCRFGEWLKPCLD
jgi:hypothetical protein